MYCPTTFETAPMTRACAVAFTTREEDMFFSICGQLSSVREKEKERNKHKLLRHIMVRVLVK